MADQDPQDRSPGLDDVDSGDEVATVPSAVDAELLELLVEATTDGVMDWNLGTGEVHYTPRWKLLLGYDEGVFGDAPTLWTDLSHPDDLPRVRELLADHLDNFWPFNHSWRMLHANGDWRWVLCRAITARHDDGAPYRLVAVFSDISERIKAGDRHRALINAVADLLLRVRRDGTLIDVKAPEDWPVAGVSWPVPGERLQRWAPAAPWQEKVMAAFSDGAERRGPVMLESVLALPGARRAVAIRLVPSEGGEAVCIVRDVTEIRRLQGELGTAQQRESLGQLTAGIGQEIHAPSRQIGDNLRFAQEALTTCMALIDAYEETLAAAQGRPISEGERERLAQLRAEHDFDFVRERLPRSLAAAMEGTRRVSRIGAAMKGLSLAGPQEERVACDVNQQIEHVVVISTSVWKRVADVHCELGQSLPAILGRRAELTQLLLNLVLASSKGISELVDKGAQDRGRISITSRFADGYVEIRIADSGPGLPEASRERIGLARSVIVDGHGGLFDAGSEAGKGTTVVIRLPPAHAGGGGGTVAASLSGNIGGRAGVGSG